MKNEYIGVYDYKESSTFRPTIDKRIHLDYPTSKTITTREDSCCVIERERERYSLLVRKLTPKECMRLMGFEDKDYEAMRECGMTDTQIYHCAGDSIVVSVLMGLFGEYLGVEDYERRIISYTDGLKEEKERSS